MARVESLSKDGIDALFATKRAEDLAFFGSKTDTIDNAANIATNTLQIATNHTDILAAQASIAANTADIAASKMTSCTSTTRPSSSLFVGKRIYETDTQAFGHWDGSSWVMTDSKFQSFAAQWITSSGTTILGTNGYCLGRYTRTGKRIFVYHELYIGSAGAGGGNPSATWYLTLPFPGIIGSSTDPIYQGAAFAHPGGAGTWAPAFGYMPVADRLSFYTTTSATSPGMNALVNSGTINGTTITQGARIRSIFNYAIP